MSYNLLDVEPKEFISDSLQDVFAEEVSELNDHFILASLIIDENNMLAGTIVGIEFGENPKLDLKVLTKSCFDFITKTLFNKCKIKGVFISLGDDSINIPGPFQANGIKIIEVDSENKSCVLAVDLFKDRP